jgi:hypothetical protein
VLRCHPGGLDSASSLGRAAGCDRSYR